MCHTIIERAARASISDKIEDSGAAPRTVINIAGDLDDPILELKNGLAVLWQIVEAEGNGSQTGDAVAFVASGMSRAHHRATTLLDELWTTAKGAQS